LREEQGLTGGQLARLSGTDRTAVSAYETGRIVPTADRLGALARALGVTPLDLVDTTQLGHGLRALRVAAGLTQADVVERLTRHPFGDAISLSRYRTLERGTARRLTNADAEALAAALNTTPDQIRAAIQHPDPG
jgi:transcriptional regulator with XRE-family HTH domain